MKDAEMIILLKTVDVENSLIGTRPHVHASTPSKQELPFTGTSISPVYFTFHFHFHRFTF